MAAVAAAGGGGGGNATTTGITAGDTSHCVGQYQFDVLLTHGPPCQPAFGGDNGGATYQGVDAQTIKIIYFESTPNEQVNAILGAKGLATSSAEEDAAIAAYQDFINKHYELWGRHVEIKKVIGDCPTTPPDYDKCFAAAQKVVDEKPFAVIWVTSLYADVFTIWANAGIVTIGGSAFDQSYYNDFRPFRYDVAMDGTQSADFISEYYCKKLVGKHPDHAGQVIHATIGTRDSVIRKLGIVVPNIRADMLTAQRVIDAVNQCGGPGSAVQDPFTYASDINSATTQTEATVASLAQNKVTTIVCMCDPIAPVFLTPRAQQPAVLPRARAPRASVCSTTTCWVSCTTRSSGSTCSGRASCRDRRRSTTATPDGCGAPLGKRVIRVATTAAACRGPTSDGRPRRSSRRARRSTRSRSSRVCSAISPPAVAPAFPRC